MTAVLVSATAWGPTHGGINSFNVDLCKAFGLLGFEVVCVVPRATIAEVQSALASGVSIVSLDVDGERFDESHVSRAATLLHGRKFNLWIGHDVVSGPFTKKLRDTLMSESPYAIVQHHHYLSYKHLESDSGEADKKDQEQRTALSDADQIFAVGPKLALLADDCIRWVTGVAPAVHEIVPGLPEISPIRAPTQFQLFFAGRLSGPASRLKQCNLAVGAFGYAVRTYPVELGTDPILTLLGVNLSPDGLQELMDLGYHHANRKVQIRRVQLTC